MTIAGPSTPLMEEILLLLVVGRLNHLERLEEVLRGLVMTVTHLDPVVLVGAAVALGLPDARPVMMKTAHGLLSLRPWLTPSSCRRQEAGRTSLFPLFPRRTLF